MKSYLFILPMISYVNFKYFFPQMGKYFADCWMTLDIELGALAPQLSDGALGAVQPWADPGAAASPALSSVKRETVRMTSVALCSWDSPGMCPFTSK